MRKFLFLLLSVSLLFCFMAITVGAETTECTHEKVFTFEDGFVANKYCSVCQSYKTAPIFDMKGYAPYVDEKDGITKLSCGYTVDFEALEAYKAAYGLSELTYKMVYASASVLGEGVSPIVSSTGLPVPESNIVVWDVGTKHQTINGIIRYNSAKYYFEDLYLCLFVYDGEKTYYITEDGCLEAPTTVALAKVSSKLVNSDKYLYRAGNKNAVSLSSLFNIDANTIGYDSFTVEVTPVSNNGVSGVFTKNTSFASSTLQFSGTGVVKVAVKFGGNEVCAVHLEIVDATNITGASGSTGTDVVLLNNVKISSDNCITYKDCTVYGNGFTFDARGGMTEYNSKHGWGIINLVNATIDNMVIIGDIYPEFGVYNGNAYNSAVIDSQGNNTIQNCYISGCAAPIMSRGATTIKNTTLYGGTVANLIVKNGVNILENVTTANYDDGRDLVGLGIVIHSDAADGTRLVFNGSLKQYNFICEARIPSDSYAKELYNAMFSSSCSSYHFGTSPNRYVNTGIVSMTDTFNSSDITDNIGLGYKGASVTIGSGLASYNGYVYTQPNTLGSVDNSYSAEKDNNKATAQGALIPNFNFDLGEQEISYDGSSDNRYLYGDASGIDALYQEGTTPLTLDLNKLASAYKYDGIYCTVTAYCKDANGNILNTTNGIVTLSNPGQYTLVFTVEDNILFNGMGEAVSGSVTSEFLVPLTLSVKEASIKDATITITATTIDGSYQTVNLDDYKLKLEFLSCLNITDYDKSGNGTSVDLSKNISSATLTPSGVNVFSSAFTIKIVYTDGRELTVNFSKISGNTPGTKTAAVNTSGGVYLLTDGALNNKPTDSSGQNKCTITSVSFKGNNGATITNSSAVTATWPINSGGSGSGCVSPETLITLADGTQVRVDQLTGNELLLVWNMETGCFDSAPIMFIDSDPVASYEVVKLIFSDGTTVSVIYEHGFWDYSLNRYVYLDKNASEYIGHYFAKQNGNDLEKVQLTGVAIETVNTSAWSPVTVGHLCYFVNGMLSMPGGVGGLFNIFEVDPDTMTYDYEAIANDIEKYGLFTYEELNAIAPLSKEMFEQCGGAYLKISIGKGNMTLEDLIYMINRYSKFY